MPIPRKDDGDEIRAMGYVAVYAAYVDENAAERFELLRHHDPQPHRNPRSTTLKLEGCLRALAALPKHPEWSGMTALFREARRLMGERNLAIHSPMYPYPGGGNTRRTRIPDDALKYVDADGIYELADELFELARELMAASVRLPRFLDEARRGAGR